MSVFGVLAWALEGFIATVECMLVCRLCVQSLCDIVCGVICVVRFYIYYVFYGAISSVLWYVDGIVRIVWS